MPNLRKILLVGAAGFAGGLIGAIFIVPFLAWSNLFGTATIFNKPLAPEQITVTKVEEKTVFIPQSDYFSKAIAKTESRVAAIQSFIEGSLSHSGSGVVLTQDGLVGTLNSLVPTARIVQVTVGGQIYSGKVIFRNYANNLAIISIGGSGLETAELKSEAPSLGQKLLAMGKTVSFGQDKPLVAEVLVARIDSDAGQFKISVPYDQFLFGSVLIDNSGGVLGLLDFRNQRPLVITSKLLEETFSAALAKIK